MSCRFVLGLLATKSSQPTYRLEERIYGRSQNLRLSNSMTQQAIPGPGGFVYTWVTSMDANHEISIFNITQLRGALEQLDLNEVAKRTIELAEDYMPGCAWLDARGNVHFAQTMGEVYGLVLCQATEVDPDSPDEVPFWLAPWLDELLPGIAERLRTALAEAIWGTAPDVG